MSQGPRDPANATAQTGNDENALIVLLVVCFALFFGVFNASALGVVLPDIAADLDVDVGQAGWLMTGFLLVYGVAIPFYGKLADLHGARPLFMLGVGIFAAGSLLSGIADSYPLLMGARLLQAAGGAAVPGLGMTLAIRAYGPESRGTVLGVIGATIGLGAAVGPLLGGALAAAWGWESIFLVNAAAALAIPVAMKVLPRDEDTVGGDLDIVGGLLLAAAVVGLILAPTEGSRSGWTSPFAVLGAVLAVVGFATLAWHQRRSASPFISKEFVGNAKFVAFVTMSLLVMAANLGPLIGLPILLAAFNGSTALEVGVILLPAGVLTGLSAVVAGRLVDRVGARRLARIGGAVMLVAVLGLSSAAGGEVWPMSLFAGLLGGGFGLVNTPLATAVSRVVRPQLLGSGLGINSMLFFIGGSLGAAVLLAFAAAAGASSLNPLHDGAASGFSNGLLAMTLPLIALLFLTSRLPVAVREEGAEPAVSPAVATPLQRGWRPDCSIPWAPEVGRSTSTASVKR